MIIPFSRLSLSSPAFSNMELDNQQAIYLTFGCHVIDSIHFGEHPNDDDGVYLKELSSLSCHTNMFYVKNICEELSGHVRVCSNVNKNLDFLVWIRAVQLLQLPKSETTNTWISKLHFFSKLHCRLFIWQIIYMGHKKLF